MYIKVMQFLIYNAWTLDPYVFCIHTEFLSPTGKTVLKPPGFLNWTHVSKFVKISRFPLMAKKSRRLGNMCCFVRGIKQRPSVMGVVYLMGESLTLGHSHVVTMQIRRTNRILVLLSVSVISLKSARLQVNFIYTARNHRSHCLSGLYNMYGYRYLCFYLLFEYSSMYLWIFSSSVEDCCGSYYTIRGRLNQ